jgi:hypothetical protein
MPPEEAVGLVYLESVLVEGRLRVRPTRIDLAQGVTSRPPLGLLWYERPRRSNRNDYWILGEGVIFVRRHPAYLSPEPMDEIEMPTRGDHYAWGDYADAIALVLPPRTTALSTGSAPQAKVVNEDRIALLWKPGPAEFDLRPLRVSAAAEVQRLNGTYGSADRSRRGERAYVSGVGSDRGLWSRFMAFWITIPDLVKAVTALILALVSLLTILNATGVCGGQSGHGVQSPQPGQPVLELVPAGTLPFNTHSLSEFPITESETVINNGGGSLRIDRPPMVTGAGFSLLTTSTCYFAKVILSHGDPCVVNIQFFPPAGPGQYVGRLTVVDSADGLTQSVDLRAIAR